MYSTTDLLNQYFDKINEESSTAGKARALRGFNQKQKMICNKKNFWWTRKPFSITSVANQQAYDLNPLIMTIESVTFTEGTISYPLIEVSDLDEWNRINGLTGTNVSSDVPMYYRITNGQILIFPRASSAGNTIDIIADSRPRKLTMEDYSTGTIAVTNGSKSVTGSSTNWLSATNLRAGAYLFIGPEEVPYEIAVVGGNSSITLVKPFFGTTASGLAYRAGDVPLIHEDYQDVLWQLEALEYLGIKKGNSKLYATLRDTIYNEKIGTWTLLMEDTLSETSSNVVQKRRVNFPFNPNEYPQDLT